MKNDEIIKIVKASHFLGAGTGISFKTGIENPFLMGIMLQCRSYFIPDEDWSLFFILPIVKF